MSTPLQAASAKEAATSSPPLDEAVRRLRLDFEDARARLRAARWNDLREQCEELQRVVTDVNPPRRSDLSMLSHSASSSSTARVQQLSLADFEGTWTSDCGPMTISRGHVIDASGEAAPLELTAEGNLELRFAGEEWRTTYLDARRIEWEGDGGTWVRTRTLAHHSKSASNLHSHSPSSRSSSQRPHRQSDTQHWGSNNPQYRTPQAENLNALADQRLNHSETSSLHRSHHQHALAQSTPHSHHPTHDDLNPMPHLQGPPQHLIVTPMQSSQLPAHYMLASPSSPRLPELPPLPRYAFPGLQAPFKTQHSPVQGPLPLPWPGSAVMPPGGLMPGSPLGSRGHSAAPPLGANAAQARVAQLEFQVEFLSKTVAGLQGELWHAQEGGSHVQPPACWPREAMHQARHGGHSWQDPMMYGAGPGMIGHDLATLVRL